MPFRFSFEALLRLQMGLEQQEESRLMERAAIVASLRERLRDVEALRAEQFARAQQELHDGANGAMLQMLNELQARLRARLAELAKEIEAAEKARTRQLAVYQKARRKREALAGLKQERRDAYEQEELRREQRSIDEAFLVQGSYRDAG